MSITKPTPRKVRVLPNKFNIYEDYVEVVLSNTQNRVLVDIEDFLRIRTYKWRETNNYAHNRVLGYMHRFILNAPKGTDVDHIFHNKLDNRKSKLRLCTRSQNNMNKSHQVNSTTKVRGVHYCKQTGKYACEIHVNKKKIWLGRYSTLDEASRVRKEAEIKYFGEYNLA